MAAPENRKITDADWQAFRGYCEEVQFIADQLALALDAGNQPIGLRVQSGVETLILQDGQRFGAINFEAMAEMIDILRALPVMGGDDGSA